MSKNRSNLPFNRFFILIPEDNEHVVGKSNSHLPKFYTTRNHYEANGNSLNTTSGNGLGKRFFLHEYVRKSKKTGKTEQINQQKTSSDTLIEHDSIRAEWSTCSCKTTVSIIF